MNKRLPIEIEIALEKAFDDFFDDEEAILRDKNETRKHKYAAFSSLKNWKKTKVCIVDGCENKSISNSHTIQKSASIIAISENGHVLQPKFDEKTDKITLQPIGVNEASTFPGYCEQHESIFEGFESIKDLKTKEHLGLQLYRTVCREIVITEHQIELKRKYIESYKALRNKQIAIAVKGNLRGKFAEIDNVNFESFKFKGEDKRLKSAIRNLKEEKENLNNNLHKFHDAVLNDIKKKKFQKLAYDFVEFPEVIPVAIAGSGSFIIKLKSKEKNVNIIINVLPFVDRTYVFVACLKKYKNELDAYMKNCTCGLQLINKVESWMMFNSYHWFLKPSVWEEIEESQKVEIIESLNNRNHNNNNGEYQKTIFNNLKLKIIQIIENKSINIPKDHLEFLMKEKRKITLANYDL